MHQIAIHVLGRRGPEAARACLRHLEGRLPADARVRFLDDGSQDGTCEAVREGFPNVEVVALPYDHGFAGAHNRGMRRAFGAGDDAVLILDEDVRPATGLVEALASVMKMRPRAAFVSPKIVLGRDPGRLWYAGGTIDWWRGLAANRGAGHADDGRFDRPGPTGWATAVAMLVRRQAFDRVGPMDARFFRHLHDVEWSVRAARIGMEVHYQPRAWVAYEAPGAGAADTWTAFGPGAARSRMRLVARHGRWYHWSTLGPLLAAGAMRGRPLRSWDSTPVHPVAAGAGNRENARNVPVR